MSTASRSRALVLPGSAATRARSSRSSAAGSRRTDISQVRRLEHRGRIEARRGKMGHRPPEAGLVERAHGQLEPGAPVSPGRPGA